MLTTLSNNEIMQEANEDFTVGKIKRTARCFSFQCTKDKIGIRTKGIVKNTKGSQCPDCRDFLVWSAVNEK